MTWLARFLFVIGVGFANLGIVHAHEVTPAYLEITETAPGTYSVLWKQPLKDGMRLKIDPVLPEACEVEDERVSRKGATIVQRWITRCDLSVGTIKITGLERTITDAYVRVSRLNGGNVSAVLRPAHSSMDLARSPAAPTFAYLRIGVEHILYGFDHLLFVFGLVLLVKLRQLFLTVTAFTLAHSVTLALATLAGISLPGTPVEIVIAMSIALLGLEAVYRGRGQETLSGRYPWLIAFGFGLIHGFGFAGALTSIGLPKGAEIIALLLFNLGVEIGQILFVAAVLVLAFGYSKLTQKGLQAIRIAAAYAIGITGTFWTLERLATAMV